MNVGERFFETEHVELEFRLPVEQVLQNLGARVKAPQSQSGSKEESMVGSVTRDNTYLYRFVPGSRNSFQQTFYGSFASDGDLTKLTGEITLNRVVKKFIILWCLVVAVVAVFTLLTLLRNPAASWGSLIYVVGMLIACMVFFRFMIKKSSADTSWLKERIARAVADQ